MRSGSSKHEDSNFPFQTMQLDGVNRRQRASRVTHAKDQANTVEDSQQRRDVQDARKPIRVGTPGQATPVVSPPRPRPARPDTAVVTTAASASTAGTSTVRSSTPASPPPTSPTTASQLPRFLQSPAQRDRSKSLSVDRPPSAASSHGTHASNSTSISSASASGRRSATRFLGIGKDKERERERQRIREAERGARSSPMSHDSSKMRLVARHVPRGFDPIRDLPSLAPPLVFSAPSSLPLASVRRGAPHLPGGAAAFAVAE
ncbi:hypothetical protein DFH06DRAFT_1467657 [Mycena polygramma]|nr:hypothetical protein DFH06DRAFT_1479428 [Mycena polygramma]KAJ7673304.1 hypothetical protein DFH06DRAFT_1467657 [Mycena polygramma]